MDLVPAFLLWIRKTCMLKTALRDSVSKVKWSRRLRETMRGLGPNPIVQKFVLHCNLLQY